MGKVMAKLPVDVLIAKFIILGHIFSVLEESIIIGKMLIIVLNNEIHIIIC